MGTYGRENFEILYYTYERERERERERESLQKNFNIVASGNDKLQVF